MADKKQITDEQKIGWVKEVYVDKTITPTELAQRENVHITNISRWKKQFGKQLGLSKNGQAKVKAVRSAKPSPAPQKHTGLITIVSAHEKEIQKLRAEVEKLKAEIH